MVRINAREQPPDRVIIPHVDGAQIQASPPCDLRNRGRERNGPGNRTLQMDRRTHLADGSGSELVVEAIEEQAQAGARTDLDERQRTGRQRREQYGAASDLVGLRPAGAHQVADLAAAPAHERPQLGRRPRHVLWSGEELDGREEEIRLDHRHVGDKPDQLVVLGHRQGKRVVGIGVPLQLRIGELPVSPLDADRIVHGSVEIVIGAWVMRQS